jgi:hypothetical protein
MTNRDIDLPSINKMCQPLYHDLQRQLLSYLIIRCTPGGIESNIDVSEIIRLIGPDSNRVLPPHRPAQTTECSEGRSHISTTVFCL